MDAMPQSKPSGTGRMVLLSSVAAILIVVTGVAAMLVQDYVDEALTHSRPINRSLAELPARFGDWQGVREELDPMQDLGLGVDEACQLRLRRPGSGWVQVLVSYSGRPRVLTGHYPEVCYPAVGWHIEFTRDVMLRASEGRKIPAQIHFMTRFTENTYAQAYVVNTLVANGVVTTDKGKADLRVVGGDRYVAQVHALFAGAESEEQVLSDAEDLFPLLIEQLGEHFQGSELTLAGDQA
jgi:hypothetical protein